MKPLRNDLPFTPQRALISVSDKRDLSELGRALQAQGVEIIATDSTANALHKEGIKATKISAWTGFPEIMDGRVKTLHPKIHGGLLARGEQDAELLKEHQIQPIDILIVNLYPFEQVIADPDCDFNRAIENIDIGGPTMVRAAAKNHANVYVIVNPEDYPIVIQRLQKKKAPAEWRLQLAKKAFAHTAAYDAAIANYLTTLDANHNPCGFPEVLTCQFKKIMDLRYGENPHQQAAFYADRNARPGSLAKAELLQGKPLSYNNLLDADAAFDSVKSFPRDQAVCVIVKHSNPCGIAVASDPLEAYLKAYQTDPVSAYGGILAFNQNLDEKTAATLIEKQFIEVIVAPEISKGARRLLASKENIRVLVTGAWETEERFSLNMKKVDGGLLVQEHDTHALSSFELQTVSKKEPSEDQIRDLLFAWTAAKHVKSNAIVYAKGLSTIGIGGGQTSRVMSAKIGLMQAKAMQLDTRDAVMASDAFIPFPDTLETAAGAGISAIIQPGGSIRDDQIIARADELGLAMVFTGIRHFKH